MVDKRKRNEGSEGMVDKRKRSKWFRCGTPPTMPGWYEVSWNSPHEPHMRFWNGRWWCEIGSSVQKSCLTWGGKDYWRGLAEKPE